MNTIAHMVIASAALARPERSERNWAILAGALAPDASMFVFFAWSRLQDWSGEETWSVQYWNEPWQTFGAVSNSFIIFGLILALAFSRKIPLLIAACAAALLHLALDFPLHADDAHRHFWPLTDWRFFSPVSYWDPAYFGWLGSLIETLFVFTGLAILWRRFPRPVWRGVFMFVALLQGLALSLQWLW